MKFIKILITALMLMTLSGAFMAPGAGAKGIRWQSMRDAIDRSKAENKKIFVHFYADWCGTCKVMERKTFRDPGVIKTLNKNYLPVKVNVDKNKKLSNIFKITLLPDTWFLTENNEVIGNRPGYISPEQLKALLKMFLEDDF
jgi:thiol:disulfide interchange protein